MQADSAFGRHCHSIALPLHSIASVTKLCNTSCSCALDIAAAVAVYVGVSYALVSPHNPFAV